MKIVRKLIRWGAYFLDLLKYCLAFPVAVILYRGRHIYLFAERGTDARDNAFHLYRYFRKEHPELEAYYVITKNSPDYEKIAKYGNIVYYRSLRHYLLFIAAEYKISTHIMGYSPHMYLYSKLAERLHLKGHRIFLQHGIIKDDLPELYSSSTNLSLFICGAEPEYLYVQEHFGYLKESVVYTGLARYDALCDSERKNQILCMPTWRGYLCRDSLKRFKESEYYKAWNRLINHPRILEWLEKKDMRLIFYPHYEVQKWVTAFHTASQRVIIADMVHYDVQQLLKESQLLITDFSSVFFDFAYMQKPCVYYQFDREAFYTGHYEKGYFDYGTMGFGETADTEEEAVEAILSYFENGFVMKETYRQRLDGFFPLRDTQNCRRIFEEIRRL